MKRISPLALLAAFALSGCAEAPPKSASENGPHFTETINAQDFYKGNVHTHSNASDGNVSPERVVSWYKQHHYSFLALTDHDRLVVDRSHDDGEFVSLNG